MVARLPGRVLALWCALAVSVLVVPTASAAGPYFEVTYPASEQAGELQLGVTYTVWLPPDVKQLRGVIVHQHGCGTGACKGGETSAYDLHWQALARKWDCALLGPSYHQVDGQNCRLWCDPRNGSDQTFLKALHELGQQSGHAELEQVPWCLWGHSGGAFWASLMQSLHPERIVAIWFRSGTAYPYWQKGEIDKPELPAAAMQIPMVCNPGGKEKGDPRFDVAWSGSFAMFQDYRKQGAPICFAADPRTAHECGDSRYLAIPFFDACLELRLPAADMPLAALKAVDQKTGWLAAPLSEVAVPAADYQGAVDEANWLPDERVARAWMEYVKTGGVSDTTPPPSPTMVQVKRLDDDSLELTWNAEADFESGIQAFVLKRGDEVVAQYPEKPVGRFGRPLLQTMSYHDTPERPLPELKLVVPGKGIEVGQKLELVTVNSVGLRSKPAEVEAPAK